MAPANPDRHGQGGTERELFEQALELPPDERAALLYERCGGDAALEQRVLRLIAVHAQADAAVDSLPHVQRPCASKDGRFQGAGSAPDA